MPPPPSPPPHPHPDPGHFLVNVEAYDLVFLSFFSILQGEGRQGNAKIPWSSQPCKFWQIRPLLLHLWKTRPGTVPQPCATPWCKETKMVATKRRSSAMTHKLRAESPNDMQCPWEQLRCQYYHFHALWEARNLNRKNIEKCHFKETELGNKMKKRITYGGIKKHFAPFLKFMKNNLGFCNRVLSSNLKAPQQGLQEFSNSISEFKKNAANFHQRYIRLSKMCFLLFNVAQGGDSTRFTAFSEVKLVRSI